MMAAAILATTLLASTARAASIYWYWWDEPQDRSLIEYMGFESGDTQVHIVMVTPNLGNLIGALNDKTFNPNNFTDILGTWDGKLVTPETEFETQHNENLTLWDRYDVFLLVLNGDDIPGGNYNYYSFDYRDIVAHRSPSDPDSDGSRDWVFFGDSEFVISGNGKGIDNFMFNAAPIPIPEPATGLLVIGGAAVVLLRRRRRR